MFNTKKVSLSKYSDVFLSVPRSCDFYCVAKIPTRAKFKLVPVSSDKYLKEVLRNQENVAGVICLPELEKEIPSNLGCALSNNPLQDAYLLHSFLSKKTNHYWTSFPSKIDDTA